MNRLTKRYNNGIVTLDADAFMETQEAEQALKEREDNE